MSSNGSQRFNTPRTAQSSVDSGVMAIQKPPGHMFAKMTQGFE